MCVEVFQGHKLLQKKPPPNVSNMSKLDFCHVSSSTRCGTSELLDRAVAFITARIPPEFGPLRLGPSSLHASCLSKRGFACTESLLLRLCLFIFTILMFVKRGKEARCQNSLHLLLLLPFSFCADKRRGKENNVCCSEIKRKRWSLL